MKKVLASTVLIFLIILNCNMIFETVSIASSGTTSVSNTQGELKQIKEKSSKELKDYVDRYGSDTYGLTAYVLDKVRIYSIPICFIGIAVGAIYQYVIGIRKLDVRDRGFGVVIAFVTLLIICQILPLIFAIVVKGWRG